MKITRNLLNSGASGAGGWTKEQLALLGVVWPPVSGWPGRIIGTEISDADAERFVALRGHKLKKDAAQSGRWKATISGPDGSRAAFSADSRESLYRELRDFAASILPLAI